jgi:hypothetical protein
VLLNNDIEAELSYAYLHAIAAHGGFSCSLTDRHLDNAGVDAIVHEDGRFLETASLLSSFDIHVQLKATFQVPSENGNRYSYSLSVPRYNKLRNPDVNSPRFLVVLYLPRNSEEWLSHSEDCLVAKRCAYWVSLRNAPESGNPAHQTIYIPTSQILSTSSLTDIMTRVSRREEINYAP